MCLSMEIFLLKFPKAEVDVSYTLGSDHFPLILNFEGVSQKKTKTFHFKGMWLMEKDFNDVVNVS